MADLKQPKEAPTKQKLPFAAIAQNVVIALLIVSLLMVAQPISIEIFGIGIYALAASVFLQIAVSNVAPTAGFTKTITKSLVIIAITVLIFVFSILITPTLVTLGR